MRAVSASFAQEVDARWHVEQPIGEGGMATVYRATDRRHNRSVALKVMLPELVALGSALRFSKEIELTARLRHPNVLPLLDSGVADGTSYYVMPFVEGGSLRARLDREGPLPIDVVLRIVADAAEALDYAHAHGVIHRDVKPENILLDSERAVVADFGIAHAVDQAAGDRLTATGIALGTPAYMSPEQTDPSRVDTRSDVYSLGCVVYEMFAGHAPFGGRTPQEVFVRHAVDPIPPIRSARPNLPESLERVISKALAKSPADRYQSCRAFSDALAQAVTTLNESAAPRQRRRFWWTTAATLTVVTAGALLLWRSNAHAAFGNRDWILVADVAGDTADAILRQALRDALTVSLQQSRYVNVEPPAAVAQTIRMMGRPDTTRLTESVAREVALRGQARVVLLPSIVRVDSTYLITARVLSPRDGADVFAVRERAAGRGMFLDALDRIAVDVRKQLGEHLIDAAPAMKLERATTQSLDALAAWTRGNSQFNAGQFGSASAEYARAISLDTNFAMAHAALGITLYWQNRSADGDMHFERALALRDRLTDRERLMIEADVANWRRQTDEAVALYRRVLEQFPDDIKARKSLGYALLRGGRCGDALEPYEWLRKHDSTDFGVRVNLATCKSVLGRFAESLREYAAAFAIQPTVVRTSSNLVHEYAQTLLSAGRPAAAESLITLELQGDIEARARAHRSLALLHLFRGQSATARELFRQAIVEDSSGSGPTSLLRDRMYLIRAFADVGELDSARQRFRDAAASARGQRLDPEWFSDLAILGAEIGEKTAAREIAARVLSALRENNARDDLTLQELQGEMALLDGNLSTARQHYDVALTLSRNAVSLYGAARIALGQQRSRDAEKFFDEIVADWPHLSESLLTYFDAHLQLAQLVAARGDTAAAREHLGWIMTRWEAGDTDLVIRRGAVRALAALGGKTNRH